MIDNLRAIAIFAEMAKQGSFRGAAKVLGLSPSVVSYHIVQLEKNVGTALVYRSTRKLTLTHEGEVLYRYAQDMLNSVQEGLNQISSDKRELTGKLTITLPSALTRSPVSSQIAEFSKQNPRVEINIICSSAREDLIANGIDLAIRAGEMSDSSLLSKRIGQINRKLVCSPHFKAQHDEPQHPQDLASWHWVKLDMLPNRRLLTNDAGRNELVNFDSQFTVDDVESMTQYCILGLGLATPPDYLVEEALSKKLLVEILPEWKVEPIRLYAVWHANASGNRKIRLLLNQLH